MRFLRFGTWLAVTIGCLLSTTLMGGSRLGHVPNPLRNLRAVAAQAIIAPAPVNVAGNRYERAAPQAPSQISAAKSIRLRGHIGGRIQAVAVQGNYAYIGEGYSFSVLKLSDSLTPTLISSVGLMAGVIVEIVVQGDYAYVADGRGQALHIIDLSTPDRPTEVGTFHADWDTNSLYVAYPYVYLIDTGRDDSNIIRLIDVSDPTNPVQVSQLAIFYDLYDVFAQGHYLYVADGSAMQIFDISVPTNPTKVGEYAPVGRGVSHLYVVDPLAYVTGYGGDLTIVNISNPTAPVVVGTYPGINSAEKIVVSGSLAYIANGDNGLTILDVTKPTAPTEVSTYDTPGSAKRVALAGNKGYIADDTGLMTVDLSKPATPQLLNTYHVPLSALGLAMAYDTSDKLYMAGGYYDGLYTFDISNPALPKSLNLYKTTATAVNILGDYLYVAGGYEYAFKLLQLTNPTIPSFRGVYTGANSVNNVAGDFNYAYLANGYNGLRVVDIQNPPNLSEIGFYDTAGYANDVVIGGNYAYVADGDAGVQIINMSNPASPTFVTTYNTPGNATGLYLNNYLYVADGYSGLRILNIADPNVPTEVGAYPTSGSASGVFVQDNLAYLAAGSGGLQLVNISNPAAPVTAGFYDLPDAQDVVAAANGWIYVAAGDAGLLSLHYPDCYRLIRSRSGTGANPTAIPDRSPNCPQGEYIPQQFITLVSNPAPGWQVGKWIGTKNDQTTSTNNQLEMPATDHEVIVQYAPTCYALTFTHTGTGTDPTATPANSVGCTTGQYAAGAAITLHASAGTGYTVGSWSGTSNNNSSAVDNTLTMPATNQSVGVNYVLACYLLTLTHSGEGSDPTATPAQSTGCPAGRHHFNESINFTTTPASGWQVSSWSGTANNSSTATSNTLTMPPSDYTVGVQYSLPPTSGVGDLYELDNTCPRHRPIAADGSETQEHSFHAVNDVDWLRFNATAGVTYRIEVRVPATSTADVNLEVYGQCEGSVVEQWNASFSPEVRLDFTAPASGPIYLRLANQPATVAGEQVRYAVTVRTLAQGSTNHALILVAGRLKGSDILQQNIHNVTNAVYKLFQRNGYDDDHIQYLAADEKVLERDGSLSKESLRAAIVEWAKSKLSSDGVLTLYLMDHGSPDLFYLDELSSQRLTPTDLDSWLSQLEQAVPNLKVNVIIEACESGSFITSPQSISKAGRLIITSTNAENDAKASKDGAYFSDHLLTWLYQGYNLFASFSEAQTVAQSIFILQKAWLDADGNGVPNEFSDGALAAKRSFAYAGTLPADDWPPHIFSVQGPDAIINASGAIQADVRDNVKVRQVWAVIYPPDYRPPPTGQELQPELLPTILLTLVDENKNLYAGKFTGFTQAGLYRVVIQAEDGDGLVARPVVIEVNAGSRLFLPMVAR